MATRLFFFFSSRRRHTRLVSDWSSDVCSSDLLRPVGFLDNDPLEGEDARAPLPVLGASWNLEAVLAERGVRHVIFTFSTAPHNVLLGMVRRCQELRSEERRVGKGCRARGSPDD